jgi:hypothetical protein
MFTPIQHSRSAFCWTREVLTQAGFNHVYDRDHPFGTIAV